MGSSPCDCGLLAALFFWGMPTLTFEAAEATGYRFAWRLCPKWWLVLEGARD
jgi:hypothetical protein